MDIYRLFVFSKTLGFKTLVAVAALGTVAGVAYAEDAQTGEGSIFTPPSSVTTQEPRFAPGSAPGFAKEPGFHKNGKGGFRHGGKGARGNHVGWHQIQMLPSLSPNQRKEIKDIYQQAKADIQPDVQQIKTMRDQFKGSGPSGLSAENKEKFSAIKTRLQAKRESVWQQVKGKLTTQQLDELDKMRAGDLKPPGLRDSG
ncbi:MAG: hypothetical protein K2Y22_01065 [Candidatus Obscuribacterales bacterium]|nr:hypothetical protein [Candidatus Obscuribacterales bacterium]